MNDQARSGVQSRTDGERGPQRPQSVPENSFGNPIQEPSGRIDRKVAMALLNDAVRALPIPLSPYSWTDILSSAINMDPHTLSQYVSLGHRRIADYREKLNGS